MWVVVVVRGVETGRELMSTYVNKAARRAAANIKVIHNR